MSGSHFGWDLGRMVLQYESLQVQDPHAFVLLRLGLEADDSTHTHTHTHDYRCREEELEE